MSAFTFIGSSNEQPNKFYYSNTGKGLKPNQRIVAAIEKCGESYGRIIIAKKYVPVWDNFVTDCRKNTEAPANKERKNSDNSTLSKAFRYPEEVNREIVAAINKGSVEILEGAELDAAIQEIEVGESSHLIDKGKITFASCIRTYGMFSKSHITRGNAGSSGGRGKKKTLWWRVRNPEEGQTYLGDRYSKLTASSDEEVEVGTTADNIADIMVIGKLKTGGKEGIAKKYLPFLRVKNCRKVDDDEYFLKFSVFTAENAVEQYRAAQALCSFEDSRDATKADLALAEAKFSFEEENAKAIYLAALAEIDARRKADVEVAIKQEAFDAKEAEFRAAAKKYHAEYVA